MIRLRYPAVLTLAALACCQQVLGIDPGIAGTGGSAGTPGSSTSTGGGGLPGPSSSSAGGPSVSASTSSTSSNGTGGTTGTSASTTSSSSSGAPVTGVCAGTGTRYLTSSQPDAFIEDFEESTGIALGWSSFNDVSPTVNAFQIMQVAGGAVNTMHSGHYAGTGAKTAPMGGFGVGVIYNNAIDPALGVYCIDISAFTGVSFWAKAATAGSLISLNFVLPATNMASMNDAGVMTGGDCTTNCYNHPRITFMLTSDWVQYKAPFAMASEGTATVGSVIQELGWLSPDSNWDFSLDEIAFYAGAPPTGAVGPNPN